VGFSKETMGVDVCPLRPALVPFREVLRRPGRVHVHRGAFLEGDSATSGRLSLWKKAFLPVRVAFLVGAR
jgi:hypothetical protein